MKTACFGNFSEESTGEGKGSPSSDVSRIPSVMFVLVEFLQLDHVIRWETEIKLNVAPDVLGVRRLGNYTWTKKKIDECRRTIHSRISGLRALSNSIEDLSSPQFLDQSRMGPKFQN